MSSVSWSDLWQCSINIVYNQWTKVISWNNRLGSWGLFVCSRDTESRTLPSICLSNLAYIACVHLVCDPAKWKCVLWEALSIPKCQWKVLNTLYVCFLKIQWCFFSTLTIISVRQKCSLELWQYSITCAHFWSCFLFLNTCRSTIVHRFLIKATIEERMQTMLKTVDRRYCIFIFFQHHYCTENEKVAVNHTFITVKYAYFIYKFQMFSFKWFWLMKSFKTWKIDLLTWFQ